MAKSLRCMRATTSPCLRPCPRPHDLNRVRRQVAQNRDQTETAFRYVRSDRSPPPRTFRRCVDDRQAGWRWTRSIVCEVRYGAGSSLRQTSRVVVRARHTGTSGAPHPAGGWGHGQPRQLRAPFDFAASLVPQIGWRAHELCGFAAYANRVLRAHGRCPRNATLRDVPPVGRRRGIRPDPEAARTRLDVTGSGRLRPCRRWRRWWVRRAGGSRYG